MNCMLLIYSSYSLSLYCTTSICSLLQRLPTNSTAHSHIHIYFYLQRCFGYTCSLLAVLIDLFSDFKPRDSRSLTLIDSSKVSGSSQGDMNTIHHPRQLGTIYKSSRYITSLSSINRLMSRGHRNLPITISWLSKQQLPEWKREFPSSPEECWSSSAFAVARFLSVTQPKCHRQHSKRLRRSHARALAQSREIRGHSARSPLRR